MQTFAARITRPLEKHRQALQWAALVCMAAVFVVVFRVKGPIKELTLCATEAQRMAVLLSCAALFTAVMAWLVARKRLDWPHFIFVSALMVVAMYIRMSVLDQGSPDYDAFLSKWVATFREHGFGAVAMEVGDYNLPYQYILAGIAALPLHDLYLIKLVSIAFDLALALVVMATVERFMQKRYGLVALATVLLLPTVWFNGAYWAQCDSLYVFFIISCLYAMLADRPVLSVTMLTLAFAFKIQTIFFFPMVLFGLLHKKYKLRHALVFVAVYLLTVLPALLAGRGLMSALTIYMRQAAQYNDRLTQNAPNIYQFFPGGMLGHRPEWYSVLQFIPGVDRSVWSSEWYTLQSVGRLLTALAPYAIMLVLALIFYLWKRRRYVTMEQVWRLSLAFALLMPLVLPKMHDRYFYLAEIFSVLYALRYPKRWFVPVLVVWASFSGFMPFLMREAPVDMRIAALMMVTAMGVVLLDLFRTLGAARAADTARAQEAEPYVL